MGLNSPELNLDLSTFYVPKTISEFLTELSVIDDISEKSLKLNDYVHMLEDEMRKINGFKPQLPLCMLLLNDAIMRLKEETMHYKERDFRPVMEEFISLKGNSDEDGRTKMSSDCSDKKNWMNIAQLWSTNINRVTTKDSVLDIKARDEEENHSAIKNSFQLCSIGNKGGAFVPFRGQPSLATKEEKVVLPIHGPSIRAPVAEMGFTDLNLEGNAKIGCAPSLVTDQMMSEGKSEHQQQKKQRRCWSPELHGLFVNAIQQLGGARAIPKQIRELMQVDGLTNDEVKSHLQRYKLHIQKLPASSAYPSNGSWLARDQYGNVSMANIGHSCSPQAGSGKWVSITGCDSMEEEEDEKSESHSWKVQLH
ncbi:hypothetical protein F0562_006542 [Nyssa sinensis]|uniref:HTH myb-type domain-containing protein n=1 Tax=Nyssa sinensis TaxID=561372 RepID=A0A5J5ART1_9ASTE|nr:hypothetical protein F0562_006542 [Nyssa sinensis]